MPETSTAQYSTEHEITMQYSTAQYIKKNHCVTIATSKLLQSRLCFLQYSLKKNPKIYKSQGNVRTLPCQYTSRITECSVRLRPDRRSQTLITLQHCAVSIKILQHLPQNLCVAYIFRLNLILSELKYGRRQFRLTSFFVSNFDVISFVYTRLG